MKKKVLHIINGFSTGGAETWLLSLVKYLYDNPELNLQFDFLITGGKPLTYDKHILEYGSKIYYLKYSMRNFFKFSTGFKKILKENSYVAIHDHQDFISGWHFLSALGHLPKNKVSHLHNPYNFVHNYITNTGRRFIFLTGRMLTFIFSTAITGTSESVMVDYGYNQWPYSKKKKKPAYCGFDTSKFSYQEDAKKALCNELNWPLRIKIGLFIGRIGLQSFDVAKNQKNPEFAFELAKKLVKLDENWRFLFVGYKGTLGNHYEEILNKMKMSDSIKFLGIRNDIPRIMSASNVLVFPSFEEGLGMVAVEAQSTGLNVIMSANVPSEAIICNELVTVKDLKDGVDSWVNNLIEVVDNSKIDRNEYWEKAKKSPFSIENSISGLLKLYIN